jgi:outer membrane murein-binding lipoprotein Lpp
LNSSSSAIQELNSKIEALKKEKEIAIEELNQQNSDLNSKIENLEDNVK